MHLPSMVRVAVYTICILLAQVASIVAVRRKFKLESISLISIEYSLLLVSVTRTELDISILSASLQTADTSAGPVYVGENLTVPPESAYSTSSAENSDKLEVKVPVTTSYHGTQTKGLL